MFVVLSKMTNCMKIAFRKKKKKKKKFINFLVFFAEHKSVTQEIAHICGLVAVYFRIVPT